jgi:hypothetical protein
MVIIMLFPWSKLLQRLLSNPLPIRTGPFIPTVLQRAYSDFALASKVLPVVFQTNESSRFGVKNVKQSYQGHSHNRLKPFAWAATRRSQDFYRRCPHRHHMNRSVLLALFLSSA